MKRLPISYIIDDGGPLNKGEAPVPISFVQRFADIAKVNGVKGKFSVLPMQCSKGRIDRSMEGLSAEELQNFIRVVHDDIMPLFSITPEILTHGDTYDIDNDKFLPIREDQYFSRITREEIARYVGFAIDMLNRVGLTPSGVTSPWVCGLDNETEYAAGIGMAFKQTLKKDKCFYFLHCGAEDPVKRPVLMCDFPETGRVITVPAVTMDPFWDTQLPASDAEAKANAKQKMDALLSEDGTTGEIVDIIRADRPVTLLTHWQSLYSDGREIGLDFFDTLTKRVNQHFGDRLQWMTLEEMAEI